MKQDKDTMALHEIDNIPSYIDIYSSPDLSRQYLSPSLATLSARVIYKAINEHPAEFASGQRQYLDHPQPNQNFRNDFLDGIPRELPQDIKKATVEELPKMVALMENDENSVAIATARQIGFIYQALETGDLPNAITAFSQQKEIVFSEPVSELIASKSLAILRTSEDLQTGLVGLLPAFEIVDQLVQYATYGDVNESPALPILEPLANYSFIAKGVALKSPQYNIKELIGQIVSPLFAFQEFNTYTSADELGKHLNKVASYLQDPANLDISISTDKLLPKKLLENILQNNETIKLHPRVQKQIENLLIGFNFSQGLVDRESLPNMPTPQINYSAPEEVFGSTLPNNENHNPIAENPQKQTPETIQNSTSVVPDEMLNMIDEKYGDQFREMYLKRSPAVPSERFTLEFAEYIAGKRKVEDIGIPTEAELQSYDEGKTKETAELKESLGARNPATPLGRYIKEYGEYMAGDRLLADVGTPTPEDLIQYKKLQVMIENSKRVKAKAEQIKKQVTKICPNFYRLVVLDSPKEYHQFVSKDPAPGQLEKEAYQQFIRITSSLSKSQLTSRDYLHSKENMQDELWLKLSQSEEVTPDILKLILTNKLIIQKIYELKPNINDDTPLDKFINKYVSPFLDIFGPKPKNNAQQLS